MNNGIYVSILRSIQKMALMDFHCRSFQVGDSLPGVRQFQSKFSPTIFPFVQRVGLNTERQSPVLL